MLVTGGCVSTGRCCVWPVDSRFDFDFSTNCFYLISHLFIIKQYLARIEYATCVLNKYNVDYKLNKIMVQFKRISDALLHDAADHHAISNRASKSTKHKLIISFFFNLFIWCSCIFILSQLPFSYASQSSQSQFLSRIQRAVRPVKIIRVRETDYRDKHMELGRFSTLPVYSIDGQQNENEIYEMSQPNRWIYVDKKTGVIRVNESLDFEQLPSGNSFNDDTRTIRADLKVFKTGAEGFDIQPVEVQVEDVNDERPYFVNAPKPFQTVVPINAQTGVSVYKFDAIDPDRNSRIKYRLVRDQSANEQFIVDENTGNVIVARPGFDTGIDYVIFVRAEDVAAAADGSGPQYSAEERLSIKGGERQPQFYEPAYALVVPENKEPGSKITQVKAVSFSNKDIRYELTGDASPTSTFRIDAVSGDIFLERALDYDDPRNPVEYRLGLKAQEVNGQSTAVRLNIVIEDNNDNSPKFDIPTQQVWVREDAEPGTLIAELSATDADEGLNGEMEFFIVNNGNFTIAPKAYAAGDLGLNGNGGGRRSVAEIRLRNAGVLDADRGNRENKLIVRAVDKGAPARTGQALVRVFARNTNDEAPIFTQAFYHASLQENAQSGMTVAAVVAKDIDGDRVKYGFGLANSTEPIKTQQGQFVIDEDRGVIQLHNSPVFLSDSKYVLHVTAVDDGKCCGDKGDVKTHRAGATVVVSVTDVNDNKPYFPNCSQYQNHPPMVEEEVLPSRYVTTVQAVDQDSGVNGEIEYGIETDDDQPPMFSIDRNSGVITVAARLDREASRYVSITVMARDKGIRPLVGGCSFKIELTDTNDNAPVFQREIYEFTLRQDTPIGRFRNIMAIDKDAGRNAEVTYRLEARDSRAAKDIFDIDNATGWLYTKRSIPATPKEYRLRALASDRGPQTHTSEVPVIIRITDVKSRPPKWFERPRKFR